MFLLNPEGARSGDQGRTVVTSGGSQETSPGTRNQGLQRFEYQEKQMGVPCDLILYAPSEELANAVSREVYDRISALNRCFSDYEPESEVMRLSRSSGMGERVRVSDELLEILTESRELSESSEGAFDVTIGPLVRLWRKSRRVHRLPSAEELSSTRDAVGYRFMEIDPMEKTVALTRPKMLLDLGGIAKGYAAQAGIDLLRSRGFGSALCALAGDIVVSDSPPDRSGWRIGISSLNHPDAPPERFVSLVNGAISTSGDSQQFIMIDGVRYSHILDPKTGLGLTSSSSVTVISSRGSTADALGTTVSLLPPERGLELVGRKPGSAVLIQRKEQDRVREYVSAGFDRYIVP